LEHNSVEGLGAGAGEGLGDGMGAGEGDGTGAGAGPLGEEFPQSEAQEDTPCCDGWKQYWVPEESPCFI